MEKKKGTFSFPSLKSFTGAKLSDTLIIIQIKIALISINTFELSW
jgi:hypothetical protein